MIIDDAYGTYGSDGVMDSKSTAETEKSFLMRDAHRSDVERGQVLAKPGTARGYKRFTARVYILTINEGGRHTPLLNNIRQQFRFRIGDMTGSCMLPEGVDMCAAGRVIEIIG